MKFPEFIGGLPEDKRNSFSIGPKHIEDFMLSSYNMPQSKMRRVYHLDIPVHFCIKHKNQGKIESYKWFFKGFCDYMQPEFCQMVDVGSIPLQGSISSVIMHMEAFPNVGGACGEIECELKDAKEDGSKITFPESVVLRSQYVEYKIAHFLDKSIESMFGFVSVLPGAFSTYRWECIKGRPLKEFLKGARDEFNDEYYIVSCPEANKHLVEDRIM